MAEELDFDDPSFLVDVEPNEANLTYAQKRKRDIIRGEERGRSNSNKSRRQREEEARDEGLRTNLLSKAKEEEGESKALRMMRMQGFVPGEALGKKSDAGETKREPVASTSARPMIGRRRSASPVRDVPAKARTEPIQFQMREGRTGLGVPGAVKKPRPLHPEILAAAQAAKPLPSVDSYLERQKQATEERRASGVLRAVRRTCEELDRRNGIEDSVMWKEVEDTEALERKDRLKRAYLRGDSDPDADLGVDIETERKDEDERRRVGKLAYATGLSNTLVELDDDEEAIPQRSLEDIAEEEAWLGLDSQERLSIILAYLRKSYFYCFWCGCAYQDQGDLKACPGELEEDH